MLSGGITLGGKAARGIGLAQLNGSPVYRVYDLASVQDHAAWSDDRRAWQLAAKPFPVGKHLQPVPGADSAMLEVRFTLGIPRGQDILVGDGKGLEHEIEPQRIEAADGQQYWRLPGASLRGLFRSWVARLAVRKAKLLRTARPCINSGRKRSEAVSR